MEATCAETKGPQGTWPCRILQFGGESMKRSEQPFEFVAASYLVRIRSERASTLAEMAHHLRHCSEESIFYHTFQSLETHHYSVFSSDFAQWILAACNEAILAERLAAVDLRGVISLAELRSELVGIVEEHLQEYPQARDRAGFEPFHFCEAVEITVPLESRAYTLGELAEGIRRQSLQTLHYHLITSRLRLKLKTNDFSHWIDTGLGMPELAARLNDLDIYTNTLAGLREEAAEMLDSAVAP